MSDISNNIETAEKPKKATAKKAPAKKAAAKPKVAKAENSVESEEIVETKVQKNNAGHTIIVFESGTAYVSGDFYFTKDNRIQQVPSEDAARLLELENFRLADQLEIEEFLASKED